VLARLWDSALWDFVREAAVVGDVRRSVRDAVRMGTEECILYICFRLCSNHGIY